MMMKMSLSTRVEGKSEPAVFPFSSGMIFVFSVIFDLSHLSQVPSETLVIL